MLKTSQEENEAMHGTLFTVHKKEIFIGYRHCFFLKRYFQV